MGFRFDEKQVCKRVEYLCQGIELATENGIMSAPLLQSKLDVGHDESVMLVYIMELFGVFDSPSRKNKK